MKSQQSTNAFVKETFMDLKTQLKTVAKNHQASIQNLETKFNRLADKKFGRPSGSLPSNNQPNLQVTVALIDVNAAQSKLMLLENFNENYSKCFTMLMKFTSIQYKVILLLEDRVTMLVEVKDARDNRLENMLNYALWEVTENGLTLPKTQVVEGVITLLPITSVEDKAQRRLEVKARSTLMMGIPNEHQLKFNSIKDAKLLLEAVEKRFGGNAATKKTQRNLLKQQYKNFTAPSSEMLDQTFDRLQKFLVETNTVVWRNKAELETMSMDDLYNNLKVYEPEVKGMSSSSSSTQNMAFVSSSNNNTSSSNEAVNAAHGVTTASTQSSNFAHKALQHFHTDDIEEMDLRWQMAMLTMRARRAPRNQDNKNKESSRRSVPMETSTSTALVSCDGLGEYDWSLESVEEKLEFYKKNESVYVEKINGLKWDIQAGEINIMGNSQIDLQDQGVINSGCSRHMTWNMSYLTDYEEIDGGYVSFGGNPRAGKNQHDKNDDSRILKEAEMKNLKNQLQDLRRHINNRVSLFIDDPEHRTGASVANKMRFSCKNDDEPSDSFLCTIGYLDFSSDDDSDTDSLESDFDFGVYMINPIPHILPIQEDPPLPLANVYLHHLYQWKVMPFGLKNAPSAFQKAMITIFELILANTLVYIDDILLFSVNEQSYAELLSKFYSLVTKYGIMLSEKKMEVGVTKIQFLGMEISDEKYQPQPHMAQELLKFLDELSSQMMIQQFLGLKKNPLVNAKENFKAVKAIKCLAEKMPPLKIPASVEKRILQTDASDECWGAVLLVQDNNNKRHVCGYKSGTFFKASDQHYYPSFLSKSLQSNERH
ncbi:putative reverse transcriptase domain, viral movement protein [Tanacetum coccineum]